MNIFLRFVFAGMGFILASGLPVLVSGWLNGKWSLLDYFQSIQTTLQDLWPVTEIAVFNYRIQRPVPLFPQIFEYISYSMQILFLALAAAVASALVLTVLSMLLSEKSRKRVKMTLYFMESLPDLLVIMLAQLIVVFIFQQTGFLVSELVVLGDNRIYWLPVLCLSILPMIQLYRLSMLTFQEEERQMYVDLARALGFSKVYIVLWHIFRNAIISVFFQSKKTMWFMLSNLFVLELMFNMPGIMLFLRENMTPQVFLITVFSFFLPMFFLYEFGEWYFVRRLRGKEAL